MRIALVNVQYHEGNNVFPPLGLLYVAAALQRAGHQCLVIDGDPRRRVGMVEQVVAFRPALVGLSFLTMTWDRARDLARALRASLPEAVLVAGGAHATADPDGTISRLPFDAVVVGEGEEAAAEIAGAVEDGRPLHEIPGVVTATGRGPARLPAPDLDALDFPARDLLGHEPYLRPPGLIRGWASSRIASVLGGRGCPFKCSYCASHQQLGRRVRLRSPGNVRAELSLLQRRDGVRGLYWVDDVFTHDRDWTLATCEAIRPLGLHWGCQSRADAVDGPLLRAMKAAGCVQVDVGVESGSPRLLKAMHKGVKPAQVVEAFDTIHASGLRAGASFILGYPGETEDDILATAALAARIRADWTVFFLATPYPGTELWRRHEGEAAAWPDWGESWNNRVSPGPMIAGPVPPEAVASWRARLQNRHFRRNYLRARNVPFMLRLLGTLPRRPVREAVANWLVDGGRADSVVEAAFSEWRAA
ncbi:MAG: radical SAM protein [Deltaproteobacteria bacterium]|nr:radical SAM protein [Deltaproteobacteria bacterium]